MGANQLRKETLYALPKNKISVHKKIKEYSYQDGNNYTWNDKRNIKTLFEEEDSRGIGKYTKKINDHKT